MFGCHMLVDIGTWKPKYISKVVSINLDAVHWVMESPIGRGTRVVFSDGHLDIDINFSEFEAILRAKKLGPSSRESE